jgi:hypothetical protein
MVVLIRHCILLCKIIREDSDGTSGHEERFDGSRPIVYKGRLFGILKVSFPSLFTRFLV